MTTTDKPTKAARSDKLWMVSVFDGRECRGHVMHCGKLGYRAFDRDDQPIKGYFASQRDAANALVTAAPSSEIAT
jgi:hypothetical protein